MFALYLKRQKDRDIFKSLLLFRPGSGPSEPGRQVSLPPDFGRYILAIPRLLNKTIQKLSN